MTRSVEKPSKLALFLLLLALGVAWADVKLRIYLRDGSLQAGNLVTEDKERFVILSKDGRQEIPKAQIMFVNGKTLSQWEARPDKNYSTEIMPQDVPDAAFVNDKAALPPLKPVDQEPVRPPPESAEAHVYDEPDVVQEEEPAPQKPAVVEPVKPVAPTAVGVKKKPVVRQPKKPKSKPKEPDIQKAEVPTQTGEALVASPLKRPDHFDRKLYAEYHYQLAQAYLSQGAKGQALQELHMANTLNKWDERVALQLGKMYIDAGVFPRAQKYLDLPALRNNNEVIELSAQMKKADTYRQRKPWIYGGGTLAAMVLTMSLLLLRRPKAKEDKLVITSENIDEVAAQLETDKTEDILPTPKPVISLEVVKPEPMPKPPPGLLTPKPVEMPSVPPVIKVPEKPAVRPPIMPPAMPPVVPAVSAVPSESMAPEGSEETIVERAIREREEIIKVGKQVSELVQKGHQCVADGLLEKARRDYRTAVALNPLCMEAYLGLGTLCFMQGMWELALEHYVKALEIQPSSAEAHYAIGRVLYETDRLEEAVTAFQKSLSLDPAFDEPRDALTVLGKAA